MNNLNKFGLPAGLGGDQNSFARPVGIYQVPTDFVELPSQGKFYPKESSLHGVEKLEVKYMTAREEDLLVSPSLQKEGLAIDRMIESLVINKNIKASELLSGDKTAILLNARKNAYGDDYKFPFICKSCGNICETSKSLSEVGIKKIVEDENARISENGNILIRLPKTGVWVELKILTSEDEAIIQKAVSKREKNNLPPETLLTRYRQMFVSINGDTDFENIVLFIGNMPIMDSTFLKKKYVELSPDIDFNYQADCSHCSTANEGSVPIMANFFSPDL